MSKLSSKQTRVLASALARNVSQQKQAIKKGRSGRANLRPPIAPVWWDGDPVFAGLVPRDEQEVDMTIMIPQWPGSAGSGETDTLQFQWKPLFAGDWQDAQAEIKIPGPLDSNDFPMALMLDKSNFAVEGTFELCYTVTNEASNPSTSDTTSFIIDKTPPNNNQSPAAPTFLDAAIVNNGITQEYLSQHADVVLVIPIYQYEKPGDTLEIYIHEVGTSPTAPVFSGPIDSNRQIKIPAAVFSGLRDGLIYVSFRLVDKVGNKGGHSDNTTVGLFLNPLPVVPLDAPRVPRIADDGVLQLVDIDRANTGLVEIDPYANALEGDRIVLTWGTAQLPVTHNITDPFATSFLSVPYETILKPAYGAATTVLPTQVSYVVERGDKSFASDAATINVDFFVPGPVNPDRPDPVNSNLPRVTVRGSTSTVDNVLTEDDVGDPVTVKLKLYDPVGTGEEMVLYWGSVTAEVGRLSPVTGSAGDDYEFTLDWDTIKDLPSSTALPVSYTVGRINPPGNVESCVPTLVDVSAALPIKLANPEFPEAATATDGSDILNCGTHVGPDQLVSVRIPGNAGMLQGGETLEFTWQCYTDKAGTAPVNAPLKWERKIIAAEASNGFEFLQGPFEDFILPTGLNGSIKLTYVSDTTPPMQGETLIRATGENPAGVCPPNSRRRRAGGCGC
ncbi:hypothetical protein EC919_104305 [Pseudomonas graminis]|uniref:hypothetical protein n=1 Tax=Pseudomonas graminis TaxID=158627 RepID=UPI00105CA797|nr:hypothetical protein [Pseudomonas graminis]TDV54567.1 hypothetical protein EC919_104305 [Pseudomonas graminis]